MPELLHPRLNRSLGPSELREYLEGKDETARFSGNDRRINLVQFSRIPENPSILLIAPPMTIPLGMQKRCMPPLGLSYIAAALEQAGFHPSIIDCVVYGYELECKENGLLHYGLPPEMLSQMIEYRPDVVGISVLFSSDIKPVKTICRIIKRSFPSAITVVGGLHPTIYPKDLLDEPAIDFVIRGEGEERLPQLLRSLTDGCVDANADGLASAAFINPQRQTIVNLDALPFPAYHLLPIERYFEINVPFSPVPKGDRVLPMLTSRGCPISCSFCASTNMYKQYRTRSVANVIAEIETLKTAYQIDEIQFADDNLTLLKPRTQELMAGLAGLKLQWCTPNGTMVNTLGLGAIELMKHAGLYQITLSLDSASVRTLKERHHKPVDLERIPGLIAECDRFGIWTHGTLVVGMPGETIEEIKQSFERVLNEMPFTSISTFIAAPIPGSELYHASLESDTITRQAANETDTSRASIRGQPAELEMAVQEFQMTFAQRARQRNPAAFQQKYDRLIKRSGNPDAPLARLT